MAEGKKQQSAVRSEVQQLRKFQEARNQQVFKPNIMYYVYLKPEAGGGRTVLIVDRDYTYGGYEEASRVNAYEVSKGQIGGQAMYRAELTTYPYLGKISARGAIHYYEEGGDIHRLIDLYGTRTKRRGLFKRIVDFIFGKTQLR